MPTPAAVTDLPARVSISVIGVRRPGERPPRRGRRQISSPTANADIPCQGTVGKMHPRPKSRPQLPPSDPPTRSNVMPPIIEAVGLAKHYGDVHALDGLDLVAESGRVTALLGPNGAGKTTFISAVATLLRPTAGELRVAGIDVAGPPEAGPPGHRPRRPVRLGRAGDDRAREPRDGRPPVRPRPGRRPKRAASEVLELLGLDRRRRPAGPHLLRRHAAPARPRRQPRRPAPAAAARRAHHRPRPAQPRRAVGGASATWSPTAPTSCSPRSTSRRPTSWPATS